MLGKLFKHEMKATSVIFLPLFIGFIVVTLLCKASFESSTMFFSDNNHLLSVITILFFALYFIYVIALFVVTGVFIVLRFYRSMVGEQGYLTNTLPVKTKSLIHAKLLSSFIWELIAIILLLLSFLVFFMGHINMNDINEIIREFNFNFGPYMVYVRFSAILISFIFIVSLFYGPLMLYASIAIGHMFRKQRILCSVVAYFVMYFIIQLLQGIYFLFSSFGYLEGANTAGVATEYVASLVQNTFMYEAIASVLFTVVFYLITCFVFQKKLNLD